MSTHSHYATCLKCGHESAWNGTVEGERQAWCPPCKATTNHIIKEGQPDGHPLRPTGPISPIVTTGEFQAAAAHEQTGLTTVAVPALSTLNSPPSTPPTPMFTKLSELLRDKADTVTFTVARENDTQLRVNFYPRLNHTNTHVEQGLNTPLQIVATPAEFDGPEFLAAIARFNTSAQGLVAAVETVEAAHKAAATTASTPAPKGKTPAQVAAKKAEEKATKAAEPEEEETKADEGGSLDI